EVEVPFDVPAPQVDEDRRGGDQAEGRRGGAERAGAERQGRRHGRGRNDAALERAVGQALAGGERKGGDADRLQPEEGGEAAVAPPPHLVRELRALGEGGPQSPGEPDEGHERNSCRFCTSLESHFRGGLASCRPRRWG